MIKNKYKATIMIGLMINLFLVVSSSYAVVYDVTQPPFNADGTDSNDDHAAIQQAIDCAIGEDEGYATCGTGGFSWDGSTESTTGPVYGEVLIPAGKYLIGDTITIDAAKGLIIRGEGSGGDGTSQLNPSTVLANSSSSTTFVMFESTDSSNLSIRDLTIDGEDGSSQTAEIIWQSTSSAAQEKSNQWINVKFMDAETAIEFGGSGEVSGAYLHDVTFVDISDACVNFQDGDDANFHLTNLVADNCNKVLHFEGGGSNVSVESARLVDVTLFADIDSPGNVFNTMLLQNIRQEVTSGNRKLLDIDSSNKGNMIRVVGYQEVGEAMGTSSYLCDIGPRAVVTFDDCIFNSRVADMSSITSGYRSYLTIRNSIYGYGGTDTSPQYLPDDASYPSVNAGNYGLWQTIDCTKRDSTNGLTLLADEGNWGGRPPKLIEQLPDPTYHWKFDGDATDSQGSKDMTASGGASTSATGTIDQAADLDGTDDYLYSATFGSVRYKDISVSVWFKLDSTGSQQPLVVQKTGTSTYCSWLHVNSDNVLESTISTNHTITGTTALSADKWYHATFTKSYQRVIIYLDGEREAMGSIDHGTVGYPVDADQLLLGFDGTNYLGGKLDDVRYCDSILLTKEQAKSLYRQPIALWRMEETTAADSATEEIGGNSIGNWSTDPASVDGQIMNGRNCVSCYGSSDSMVVDPGETDFSATAWVYLNDKDFANLFFYQSGHLWLGIDVNNKLFSTLPGSTITGSTALDTSTWYHVAVVKEGNAVKIYLNGNEDASGTGTINSDTGEMLFGLLTDARFDDVRVYNRALSADEISDLHTFENPVGNWTLDELITSTSPDEFEDTADYGVALELAGDPVASTDIFGTIMLDGTGDYLETASTVLDPSEDDFTAMLWFRSLDVSSTFDLISQVGGEEWLYVDSSKHLATDLHSSTLNDSYKIVDDNEWYHAAVVYDSSSNTLQIFLNGDLQDETTSASITSATGVLRFGDGSAGTGKTHELADIRIYQRALPESEIKEIYRSQQ